MIETNKIYCGDNLELLRNKTLFPNETVDLIYLDPPFFSGKNYELIWKEEDGELIKTGEIAFRDTSGAFTTEEKAYEERDVGLQTYINWMVKRLNELYRILKTTGSIYLHCDWHASHYLKVEMDKIFGYNNFQNEIVWCYSGGGQSKSSFPKKHDVILFYSKGNNWTFNYNDPSLKTHYCRELSDKEVAVRGDKTYGWKGNPLGKMFEDWWQIPILNPVSKERLGYPTQKPEALLERIIKASSKENDIVFDPFCGCGTSIAVAKRLNRKFIGIDISPSACMIIAKRIDYSNLDILGYPFSLKGLSKMKPHEFQQWVCEKMIAKNTNPSGKDSPSGRDGGKDGIIKYEVGPEWGGAYLQVKRSESVGVDTIDKLYAKLDIDNKKRGIVVAFSFSSGAKEKVAEFENKKSVIIKLITTKELTEIEHYDYGNTLA